MGRKTAAMMVGATLAGCAPDLPPVQARSRYFEIATSDPGWEACEGTLRRLDAFVEGVFFDLGEALPEDHFIRYHIFPDQEPFWPCSDSASACTARQGTYSDQDVPYVFSTRIDYHEVAHAIHYHLFENEPPSFFIEGFAMRYSNEDGAMGVHGLHDERLDLESLLSQQAVDSYREALIFTNAVVDLHGIDAYKEVFGAMRSDRSPDDNMERYEDLIGESMQMTEEAYRGNRVCEIQVTQCLEQPTPWDGEVWQAPVAGSCDSPFVFASGVMEDAQLRLTLPIDTETNYSIRVPEATFGVELIPCDAPCGIERDAIRAVGDETTVAELPIGHYEMVSFFDLPPEVGTIEITRATSN